MATPAAVFLDIGDTLGSAVVENGHLSRIDVYPFVPEVLRRMGRGSADVPVALGLISNTGDETRARLDALLDACGLAALVDPSLVLFSSVEGLDKTRPEFFALAAERASLPPPRCVYVGESAAERGVAATAGLLVSPHPLHALNLVEQTFLVTDV